MEQQYLKKESKGIIYKSFLRPLLVYSAKTRTETTKSKQLLKMSEMKIFRKVVKKSRRHNIKNK